MNTVKREDFVKGFVEAIKVLKEEQEGTYHWWLRDVDDDEKDWAVVIGWAEGWSGTDCEEDDDAIAGDYRIMAKIAYQSKNSVLQCDYNWDWEMPYDKETGEVDDMDWAIFGGAKGDTEEHLKKIANDILDTWNEYKKNI